MEALSAIEYVAQGMKDNIYIFTVEGKCSGCGNCCSNILPMSKKEINAIHDYIKKHNIRECKHFLPTAKLLIDMTCPFLDIGKAKEKCRIYPMRPFICKKFICDGEQRAKLTREETRKTRQIVNVREEFFGENNQSEW